MKLLFVLCLAYAIITTSVLGGVQIKKQCGESFPLQLEHDGVTREALLYIPKLLCVGHKQSNLSPQHTIHQKQNALTASTLTKQITLPILVALHCYGGGPENRIANWHLFAEEFTFILIAPKGIQRSWNADQCCGYALQQKLNDIGFIQQTINETINAFSSVFPSVTLSDGNHGGYLWISGFSNGGFMADKIVYAWQSTTSQFTKIIASAPMAGYIYDRSGYIERGSNHNEHRNVAMYFHHSGADTFVRPDGCCKEKSPKCCCGISDQSNQCLSVYHEFQLWMQWNDCREGLKFEDLKTERIIEDKANGKSVHATCADATPQDHGCRRMTSLCIHDDNTMHDKWSRDMPQAREVMRFFLKSLCLQQRGTFSDEEMKCHCSEEAHFEGSHCITPKMGGTGIGEGVGNAKGKSWNWLIVLAVIIGLSGLGYVRKYGLNQRTMMAQYTKVKVDDDIESTEELITPTH